jgi:HEAT repeat protein
MLGIAAAGAAELEERALETGRSLEPLLRGDPVEAMEAAKQIIGKRLAVDAASLEAILSDKKSRKWSRIAAIYSLGFLGERSAVPSLLKILSDDKEPVAVRAHAAEALGNIGDTAAVPAVAGILRHETSPSLRKSCAYSLEEINTPEARVALQSAASRRRQFKRTAP